MLAVPRADPRSGRHGERQLHGTNLTNPAPDSSAQLAPSGINVFFGSCEQPHPASQPRSIAAGDFDGDGNADLAVANAGSSSLSILTGDGDGTVTEARTIPLGFAPALVLAADFRGIGRQDLAVTNAAASEILILLGNGDGTFVPAQTLALPAIATAFAAGNVTGTAVDLLVTSGTAAGSVSVLRGNGDGTFQPAVTTPLSLPSPSSIAITDFGAVIAHDSTAAATVLVTAGGGTSTSMAMARTTSPLQPRTVSTPSSSMGGHSRPMIKLRRALPLRPSRRRIWTTAGVSASLRRCPPRTRWRR